LSIPQFQRVIVFLSVGRLCRNVRPNIETFRSINVAKKRDVVQVKNPKTNRYVKIDRGAGRIISSKKSKGPYSNIPVARKKK